MLSRGEQATIRETIKEFFERMTIPVELRGEKIEEDSFETNLETEAPQILIGENGQTLIEIQHLLRLMVVRKLGRPFYLNLDVNDYRKKKTAYLEELARSVANEVALTHQEKELLAMTAQERRIIHVALANRLDIVTESRGEEPGRRVVIKPASKIIAPSELP
jgi:spoIIIJ-associated protein